MSDFFKHDPRIEENTALRDLEKKVHYLISVLNENELLVNRGGNAADDFASDDVSMDAAEVRNQVP
jgi:hypothetical protein